MSEDNRSSRYLIGITDYFPPPYEIEALPFNGAAEMCWLDMEHQQAGPELERVDALIVWHAEIDASVIERLQNCRIVVRYGVGFDNIDLPALNAAGIAFSNTPDYGTEEVADTAVAMLLSHLRKVPEYDYKCRHYTSGWQEHVLPPLKRSNQTTVGIVGLGRIGSAVALRLKGFGFDIVGFDPFKPSGHEKSLGIRRSGSLMEMLAECDAVTVHCPLDETTRGLIDSTFVDALPKGAVLVNTARGGLLESVDVIETALRSGQLYAVALDVLPDEPPKNEALVKAWRAEESWLRGRLTINPHSAYFSDQASYEMRYKAGETARLFLKDGLHRNRID